MPSKSKGPNATVIFVILLLLAIFFGWLGYEPGTLLNEYARGLALTLLGAGIVIYALDSLSRRRQEQLIAYFDEQRRNQDEIQLSRETQLMKSQLLRELSSGDPGLAARAIKELDEHGWLTDGTLAESQLSGADLHGANLGWINLSGAFLGRINLQDAQLNYANFSGASLVDANLARANLDLANFTEADLRDADFSLATLNEADFTGAVLDGSVLSGAVLANAILTKTQAERVALAGANLAGANLQECNLSHANLEKANLSGANLGWAVLNRANLEKADLSEATLSGANLEDARLNGANLSGAFLYGAQVSLKVLSTARSLANATMPDGTKYEEWVRRQSGEQPTDLDGNNSIFPDSIGDLSLSSETNN